MVKRVVGRLGVRAGVGHGVLARTARWVCGGFGGCRTGGGHDRAGGHWGERRSRRRFVVTGQGVQRAAIERKRCRRMSFRVTQSPNSARGGSIGLVNGKEAGLRNPSVIEFPSASHNQAIRMAFTQKPLPAPFTDFAVQNHSAGVSVEPKTDGGPNRAQWTRAICRRRMPLHDQILPLNCDVRFFWEQSSVCGANQPSTARFAPNPQCQRLTNLIGLPRFARTQQARLGGAHQRLVIDSCSLTAGRWWFRDGSAHPEHGNEERGGTDDVELDKKCWNPIEILKVTKSALGNDDAHQDA
jgi:hypothetical protein